MALNVQNEAIKLMEKTIEINSSLTRNDEMLKKLNSLYTYSRKEEMKVEIFNKSSSSSGGSRSSSSSLFSGSGSGYSSGDSGYSSGSGYSGGGSGCGGGGEC